VNTDTQTPNSEAVTRGIRISAEAQYLDSESDPSHGRHFYVYRIRITNDGMEAAQLLSRQWVILDANNRREEVEGEGVVGKQPKLEAGESFEYTSYCPLRTSWGTMEGSYAFITDEGEAFEAKIARFFLAPNSANAIVHDPQA
jgi:ApaG protein